MQRIFGWAVLAVFSSVAPSFACTNSSWTTSLGTNTFSFSEAGTGATLSGTFVRQSGSFVELTVVDKAPGTSRGWAFSGTKLYATEVPGISLVLQPIIEEDLYHPVISLAAACPVASNRVNFIFEHWSPAGGNDVSSSNQPVGGYFDSSGSTSVGLAVREQFNLVNYGSLPGVNLTPTPVACSNGVAQINSGAGDRSGKVTYAGASGVMLYQTSVCHSALAMPQTPLPPLAALAGPYTGFVYDTKQNAGFDTSDASTHQVQLTINASGCTAAAKCGGAALTAAQTTDTTSFGGSLSLEVTGLNKPRAGMFEATLYDGQTNRGNVLCTVGLNLKNATKQTPFRQHFACTAQTPSTNAAPLTLLLVSGAQDSAKLDTASFGSGTGYAATAFPGVAAASAIALQPDGKTLVGGSSIQSGQNVFSLARYRSDGTLDSDFGTNGIVTNAVGAFGDSVRAVFVLNDGRILAAGVSATDALGATSKFALARYSAAGVLDTDFGTNGVVTTALTTADNSVLDGMLQSDGKVILVGACQSGDRSSISACLARYNSDGTLDSSFGTNGTVIASWGGTGSQATRVRLQRGNKILVAGRIVTAFGTQLAVARYLQNGTLDTTFGNAGIATLDAALGGTSATGLAPRADGSFVVSGQLARITPTTNYLWLAARFTLNGTLDTAFGSGGVFSSINGNGTTAGESATDIAVTADDRVLLVGQSYNGTTYQASALTLTTAGALDTGFNGTGSVTLPLDGSSASVAAMALQPDGRWLAAGAAGNNFLLLRAWP